MRALLATNFRENEVRDKIAPALSKHVELVGVVSAEKDSPFSERIDRLRPDVVFLMNEIVSHSTSYRLADVCRAKGVKLAVLGKQKAAWASVVARLAPANEGESFGTKLRRAREAAGLAYHELSNRCGVSKDTVRAWEADEGIPTRQEFKRLRGSLRALAKHPPEWRDTDMPGDLHIVLDDEPASSCATPDPPAEPKTFAEALRVARVREGLTQEELGELVGVQQGVVSAWELDKINPVLDNYTKLVDLLPELAIAPEPPCRAIDKPRGPEGMTFDRNRILENVMNQPTHNPVLPQSYRAPLPTAPDLAKGELEALRGRVVALEAELAKARSESVAGVADALRSLVRAGFLSEAEAAEKWTARIR
jgi:transcriptional regulator with XRE-family HTH domain